jgi:nucleoid DNA-binding protein
MTKPEITRQLARRAGITPAEAADRLDAVVRGILSTLRKGEEAPLPGLGRFVQRQGGGIGFEREKGGSRA